MMPWQVAGKMLLFRVIVWGISLSESFRNVCSLEWCLQLLLCSMVHVIANDPRYCVSWLLLLLLSALKQRALVSWPLSRCVLVYVLLLVGSRLHCLSLCDRPLVTKKIESLTSHQKVVRGIILQAVVNEVFKFPNFIILLGNRCLPTKSKVSCKTFQMHFPSLKDSERAKLISALSPR